MRTEGWVVQRLVFSKSDLPVAIVQILEKRIAGLFKVYRINRGPLFFPNVSFEDKMSVLCNLFKLGDIFHGSILFIAPELDFSGVNSAFLISNKVRSYNPRNWTSAWLDLNLDEQSLRSNLNGKWRNALVAAEKNIIEVEFGSSPELMDWMTDKYKENMLRKGFEGIPLHTLKELYENSYSNCPLIICRVRKDDEYIAGICIACHGSSATYLIGWSGLLGRELKANYFLLWNTFQFLRLKGFRWFDLGGIDNEGNIGVAEFKLGINGEPYSLIGEGWKM
jgi:lipid II:glycine glycyltransferase (peptidoglycan interpeptide bridge formation enzyme)